MRTMYRQRGAGGWPTTFMLFGGLFFVFGMIVTAVYVHDRLAANWADGEVVEVRDGGDTFSPVVLYFTADATPTQHVGPGSSPPEFRGGESIEVVYDPAGGVNLMTFQEQWLAIVVLTVLGSICAAIGWLGYALDRNTTFRAALARGFGWVGGWTFAFGALLAGMSIYFTRDWVDAQGVVADIVEREVARPAEANVSAAPVEGADPAAAAPRKLFAFATMIEYPFQGETLRFSDGYATAPSAPIGASLPIEHHRSEKGRARLKRERVPWPAILATVPAGFVMLMIATVIGSLAGRAPAPGASGKPGPGGRSPERGAPPPVNTIGTPFGNRSGTARDRQHRKGQKGKRP